MNIVTQTGKIMKCSPHKFLNPLPCTGHDVNYN